MNIFFSSPREIIINHYSLFIASESHDSLNSEGLSLNFIILLHLDIRELRTEVGCKLTRIEFAHDDAFVLTQHLAGVLRQRTDIVELRQIASQLIRCCVQMSFRTPPAYEEKLMGL